MTVKVTERDESKLSHEGVAAGVRIWDVHQQDQLVGMFHNESDAHHYRMELEIWETRQTKS
ncbi:MULTISPECIES: hypothetical protein [unclassified Pseudomonas]|uniref:hypothetical protein n=1 Tax=unclassified Pseudomonas TaxID=196821 RepID=UPI000BA2EBA2|nr:MULTISPECIES: hypothetical protein [unclassified Pseudomonas]MCU1721371.1 hypothetical protein [Pseudomonas sp. 5P_5.1_Bac1]MCU1731293.1 hypothetical protein [Pseudomonas sp. 20P_3.2_Bac4]MCU1747302.1 hypothetical protein [Pseudomonas sp. 20P_3.2_Bac5]